MRNPNQINAWAIGVILGCLAGIPSASACDAGQRPAKVAGPALARNVAAMAKIGVYRVAAAEKAPHANEGTPPTIVGLWHSVYTFSGHIVDQSFETYRDDGTEMEVDLGPPVIGNVCSGTWEQTGSHTFKLTHPAWTFDESGNLLGMAIIRDVVTLDRSGDKFSGTEAVDLFDINGKFISHAEGLVKATRIAPN
jgi:hypothetical protein